MIKELAELRQQMNQAVADLDQGRAFSLLEKYLALYKLCWPNR